MRLINCEPFQSKLCAGSVVLSAKGSFLAWGVVKGVERLYRYDRERHEPFYFVRRMDETVGLPLKCPYLHCRVGCVICQFGGFTDQLDLYGPSDIQSYTTKRQYTWNRPPYALINPQWLSKTWSRLRKDKLKLHPVSRKIGNTVTEKQKMYDQAAERRRLWRVNAGI